MRTRGLRESLENSRGHRSHKRSLVNYVLAWPTSLRAIQPRDDKAYCKQGKSIQSPSGRLRNRRRSSRSPNRVTGRGWVTCTSASREEGPFGQFAATRATEVQCECQRLTLPEARQRTIATWPYAEVSGTDATGGISTRIVTRNDCRRRDVTTTSE
jgi:hypothetical protein